MKKKLKFFAIVSSIILLNVNSVSANYSNDLEQHILPYELYDNNAVLEIIDETFIGPERNLVGQTLFGMRATSISAGRMLDTFNSGSGTSVTRSQLSSGRLGVHSNMTGRSNAGLAYVNMDNSLTAIGRVFFNGNRGTESGTTNISTSLLHNNYYGFIRSEESSKAISGEVSFIALR